MPIRFPDLLQDSWNFLRNQRSFTLFSLGLLILVQAIGVVIMPHESVDPTQAQTAFTDQQLLAHVFPMLFLGLINIWVTLLLILNIKSINDGQFSSFTQNITPSLAKLVPSVVLNIIMVLPVSLGISATMLGESGSVSLYAFPLLVLGIFVFIKLCLSLYAYVLETHKTVVQTIKSLWTMSIGRSLVLVQFCIIAYLVPQFIAFFVGSGGNPLLLALSMAVSAFLVLFITVFSFRFYQVFRK